MADLYMRKFRIIVAGTDITDLHCIFKIQKQMSSDPNKTTLQVYNLSPKTRNKITSGKEVIIEAGYESGQYGLIYAGEIVIVAHSGLGGNDKVTEITAQDGDVFINDKFINQSYSSGQRAADYCVQAVHSIGGQFDALTDDAKQAVLARGKAIFAAPDDYARQVAKNEEALFFIDDGLICLVKASDPPRGQVVSLTPDTGLIGSPKITEDGLSGKCLLHPNFKLNGLVHVDSAEIGAGIYRVIEFTHTGDNRGNEWYTSFVGIEQPGTVPVTGHSYYK